MKANVILIFTIIFVVIAAFAMAPRAYYSEKNPVLDELRRRLAIMSPRYAKIPLRTGKKTYTEDKSFITICIQNPTNGEYYDINVLMYVICHELSHVITHASGKESHGDEFKKNFSSLLRDAAQKGVYDPRTPIPLRYCGITD